MRTRKEIQAKIKTRRKNLEGFIDRVVDNEKYNEEAIENLKQEIIDIENETCFEDTLVGNIKELEDDADKKIQAILTEMSKKTGKKYYIPWGWRAKEKIYNRSVTTKLRPEMIFFDDPEREFNPSSDLIKYHYDKNFRNF